MKQNLLAKEILPEDFGTGFAVRIPGVHQWHRMDRRTHFVTFAEKDVRTSLGMNRPALEIRTKDNNLATYDLSVSYKIIDGSAVQDRERAPQGGLPRAGARDGRGGHA